MKQFVTYEEIHEWCSRIVDQIQQDSFTPQVVVGMCRGGLIPAVIISHQLGVPLITHHVSLRDHETHQDLSWNLSSGDQVLIVDDINDSGATIHTVNQQLQSQGVTHSHEVRWATLIHKIFSSQSVDYHAHVVHPDQSHIWWHFPWEKHVD